VFARFRDVNPLPFAEMFETDIEDGNLALLRVPEDILDALTFEIPKASPPKFAVMVDTEIEEGNWVFNTLP
jgi:hypothetical protein